VNRVTVVTGATRNLGFALAAGLASRLGRGGVVYLTGRDAERVRAAVARVPEGAAEVRGHVLDVADAGSVTGFAAALAARHGGVDIVVSNHYARVQPEDDPAAVVDGYVEVNNLGTTRVLRAFAPLLRDGGRLLVVASRAGTLNALAPALHARFDREVASLEDVDQTIRAWRDAVRTGRAPGQAWPAWINIPSKIGQVAAIRVLARQRREQDAARGILIAAVSPGLIDTGASRRWLDTSAARTPEQAAGPLLDLALDPAPDPRFYGELVHSGDVLPWAP
jgi:carbonyl reductase 1